MKTMRCPGTLPFTLNVVSTFGQQTPTCIRTAPTRLATSTPLLTALFGICLHSLGATNVIAIKAGHLLDVRTGRTLDEQVLLIEGDSISRLGPAASTPIPNGA